MWIFSGIGEAPPRGCSGPDRARRARGIGLPDVRIDRGPGGRPPCYARPRVAPRRDRGEGVLRVDRDSCGHLPSSLSRGAAQPQGTARPGGACGRLPRWRSAPPSLSRPGRASRGATAATGWCCRASRASSASRTSATPTAAEPSMFALDEGEAERLAAAPACPPRGFLESEDGEVLALPLVTPFVLGRTEGHCVFLSAELSCEQYEARPDACRSYPHRWVFVDAGGRAAQPSPEAGRRAVEALVAGRAGEGALPLLLRHDQCPGFTGPPSTEDAWAAFAAGDLRSLRGRDGRGGKLAAVSRRAKLPPVRPEVERITDDVIAVRRDLHQHPELSWKEERTQRVILDELAKLDVEDVRPIATRRDSAREGRRQGPLRALAGRYRCAAGAGEVGPALRLGERGRDARLRSRHARGHRARGWRRSRRRRGSRWRGASASSSSRRRRRPAAPPLHQRGHPEEAGRRPLPRASTLARTCGGRDQRRPGTVLRLAHEPADHDHGSGRARRLAAPVGRLGGS